MRSGVKIRTIGDPVPHHIKAALVGDPAGSPRTIAAAEKVAGDKLVFEHKNSVPAALNAINHQNVYAALDLDSSRPTLYVASATGASVARVLEKIAVVEPGVRVIDTHPLAGEDPNASTSSIWCLWRRSSAWSPCSGSAAMLPGWGCATTSHS